MYNISNRLPRILVGAVAVASALSGHSQQSLDLASQAMIRRAAMSEQIARGNAHRAPATTPLAKASAATASPVNIALVRLADGHTAEDLAADGFDAVGLRGGFAVVTCESAAEARRLAGHGAVKKCEFNRQRTAHLDKARAAIGVDNVHTGLDLPGSYTGKGVITGIVDGGFDPNHANFRDTEGNTRFKYFSTVEVPTIGSTIRPTVYTPAQLVNYSTDDNTQTHGTHTLGIMAGSFKGEATVGLYDDKPQVVTCANPYYGVAPESDIYASSGSAYDALIAYAVDGMMEHRWYNAHYTPIVINLSLGGNNGPHDGSGILSQYLDAISNEEGAIFCVSAGNEGDIPLAYHQTMTADNNTFATFIRPYVYTDLRYGMVEMYSDTEQDFDVSVIIYNRDRGRVARTFPLNNKEGQIQYICSGSDYQQDDSDIIDATFAKAYDGYVGVGGMLDEDSGRFYIAVDYYVVNADSNPADETTTEAQYTLGFIVTGHDGQRIDCYCDGTFTALDSYGYDGYVDGLCNGTISDIATTKSAIAVGSYNTREWASSISGNMLGYDGYFKLGEVTEFSSFGTLHDGRNLPHVLAPGCSVVSSISTPYFNNADNGATEETMTVKYSDGTRDNYFSPMIGTSMSSPMAAGVVALMLQANPDLDYKAVRDILVKTAVMEPGFGNVDDPVQAGAGRIDAYSAVKEALRTNALPGIAADTSDGLLIEAAGPRAVKVFVAGTCVHADIYSIDGRKALSAQGAGDELTLDLSGLNPGVYVLTVNGNTSRRIAVK